MEHILKAAVDKGATVIHIKAGDVFRARINGVFEPLTKQALTPEQTKQIAADLIPNVVDRKNIDSIRDYDCSWGAAGIGRFRVNILRQRSSFMIVLRAIPFDVPTIDKLELPEVVKTIAEHERGLVLLAGAAGSGRSSTAAAILQHINSSSARHVVTLENPIEFIHRDIQSTMTQREVGVDTDTMAAGARATLRQDADVVYFSELSDADVADAALAAAETGSLVVTSVQAHNTSSAISRFAAMFPAHERELVRARLAENIRAVLCQRLLARTGGEGRVPAVEVLLGIPQISDALRQRNRAGEIEHLMDLHGFGTGMQTMKAAVSGLVTKGVVASDSALSLRGGDETTSF
ncbi:MAG: PilT/PilU family type 4a pilus ATPase [Gemmatimonadota bacterium]|nr:PilT/PilU family type 4a pilus ATPase [Gemmatimonadota bacterium]